MQVSIKKKCRRRSNRLLDALPAEEKTRVDPNGAVVDLLSGEVLYEQGTSINDVFFPCTAVASLQTIMQDGKTVGVATVGNEGMLGVPRFLGAKNATARGIVLVPGEAVRMGGDVFEELLKSNATLHRLVRRYAHAQLTEITRSAGCNRLHSVEQRCSRWLLTAHDRADTDEFPLTQENLADMLGIRRQTAAITLGTLEDTQLVQSSRGKIRILNRQGLEALSCECYHVIKDELDSILT